MLPTSSTANEEETEDQDDRQGEQGVDGEQEEVCRNTRYIAVCMMLIQTRPRPSFTLLLPRFLQGQQGEMP